MEQKDMQNVGEVVAKKSRPKKSAEMSVQATPAEQSRYVRHVMANFNLAPIDLDDPAQVQERIVWYFNHCAEDGMKPTVAGICNALGIDRQTFYLWGTGERRGKSPEYVYMVKRAKAAIQELWEQYAADGQVNPVTFIFLMKNHYGYADKQEVVVTPQNPLGVDPNVKELEEKYRDSVPIDVDATDIDE